MFGTDVEFHIGIVLGPPLVESMSFWPTSQLTVTHLASSHGQLLVGSLQVGALKRGSYKPHIAS